MSRADSKSSPPKAEHTGAASAPGEVDEATASEEELSEGSSSAWKPGDSGAGGDTSSERAAPTERSSGPAAVREQTGAVAVHSAPSELHVHWGQAGKSVVLGALILMAIVAWSQLSFSAKWVPNFLIKNDLPMQQRMVFLYSMLGGAAAGAALTGAALFVSERKGIGFDAALRVLWFLSPLIVLPALPTLFKYQAWKGRHEDLLPVVLAVALTCEALTFQSLRHVPARVVQAFAELKEEIPRFVRRPFFRDHGTTLLVVLACLGYALFMSFFTIRWHHKLGTAVFDLGINNNLLYGGLEGHFNESPIIFPEDPSKYVANHVKIGLYAFLPIYALYPHAETLLVIQSFALGFGALPLFLIGKRHIPQWAAVTVALCYLAYYPMHGANFYEVKMVPIASFFLLTTMWAADAKRWVTCGIAFALTLIMREDMPVGLAVVGTFLLLTGYRPRAGLIMAAIASAWFVFIRFHVMEEVGQWWFPKMYKDLWSPGEQGFKSVIKTLLTNPLFTLKHVLTEEKIYYLMHLLVPLVFLPARKWYLWAAFIPGAILTLLVTDYKPPTMFSFQYVMHWAPYIFVAAVLALEATFRRPDSGRARAHAAVVAMVLASAALSYNYGAFPLRDKSLESGYHQITFSYSEKERERYADLQELLKHLPPKASVAATERVGAHVSARVGFYSLRRGSHGAEYLIARKSGLRLDRTRPVLLEALKSGKYGVFHREGEFVLFKMGHDTSGNEAIIDEWSLDRSKKKAKKRKRGSALKGKLGNDPEAKDEEDGEDDGEEETDADDAPAPTPMLPNRVPQHPKSNAPRDAQPALTPPKKTPSP